jgi:hypothetical protein
MLAEHAQLETQCGPPTEHVPSSQCQTPRSITQRTAIQVNRTGSPSAQHQSGARRDRTDDLMLAKHALSQLSYGPRLGEPNRPSHLPQPKAGHSRPIRVGLGRLERPTSPLSGVRSNHLSYRPVNGNNPPLRQEAAPSRMGQTHACPVEIREAKAAGPANGV